MVSRAAVTASIAFALIGAFYLVYPSQTPSYSDTAAAMSATTVPGLDFKLSQISTSPPSLLVTLKNNHPSSTFTVLKWGTPLDPQATNLGVFKLTNAESGEPIDVVVIKIARKTPPARSELVQIEPSTEHATEVVFEKPWMPQTKPASYKVQVEGKFYAVWEKAAKDVTESDLKDYFDSPYQGCAFSSEEVTMAVK